jgi:hypothetical protein
MKLLITIISLIFILTLISYGYQEDCKRSNFGSRGVWDCNGPVLPKREDFYPKPKSQPYIFPRNDNNKKK